MANPEIYRLTANEWRRVALNVTSGNIKKIGNEPVKYLETYRMTGDDAPTDQEEGALMFVNGPSEIIEASAGIDVYVMPVGKDGIIRVDV